jgi:hypothetical protein
VQYAVPQGFQTEQLSPDSTYSVTAGENGLFTIVPLVLSDTLDLPRIRGWNDKGDTLFLPPPVVVVVPSFPDTLMTPSVPVYPCFMNIPPGLPEDYARNLSFWLVWKRSPGFPWLWTAISAVLIGAFIFFLRRRGRTAGISHEPVEQRVPGREAEKEALALLECENFLHGKWPELYAEIDRQLRVTVSGRFGIVNRALTLNQISASLASTADGRNFMKDASSVIREIILQLYADWGSSREKSAEFIRKLAKLRREWSK